MKKSNKKSEKSRLAINETCLMIKRGAQHFFTEIKNYPLLIEFGNKFAAEISVVEVINETEILLDLSTLAKCLCNPSYTPSKTEIKVNILETKIPKITKMVPSQKLDSNQTKDHICLIQEYIKNKLKKGKRLSINELYQEWCNDSIDYTVVYNIFIKVKKELIRSGWNIERISKGIYIASRQKLSEAL